MQQVGFTVLYLMYLTFSTESMSNVWNTAKKQVVEMLRSITEIADRHKCELKWVAYRNYSDSLKIESSEWFSTPESLLNFIENIYDGGDSEEAVELGLQEVYTPSTISLLICTQTNCKENITLIADTAPHCESNRTYLAAHNLHMPTDYKEQVSE
jgi:hypothetical protein